MTTTPRTRGQGECGGVVWGFAVLLKGGMSISLGGLQSLSRGDGCEMQFLFTQDRLCMVKNHILREVTLLRRTQQI
jgi:hypothetical protein